MAPQYPLFVADRDGYGHVVHNESGLGYFEQIDVEDGEFRCWDSLGIPLAMGWKETAYVSPSGMPADTAGMLAALKKWAEVEGLPVLGETDPATLLVRIQAALEARWAASGMGRLVRFVKRAFGRGGSNDKNL
jgi:hypothetical protein